VSKDADPIAARLAPIAAQAIDSHRTAGMVIAVARDHRLVFARGYGTLDEDTGVAVRPDTVFRIGSITKQFTAALVLRLVEQQKLGLDDEIGTYLPQTAALGKVTIRQLLEHTGGVHDYPTDPDFHAVASGLTLTTLIDFIVSKPLDFAPGTEWRYSNSGYILLGALVEKLYGQPYTQLVDDLVRPLGIGVRVCPDEPSPPGEARGYTTQDGKLVPSMHVHMVGAYSAGALCATAADLVTWNESLAQGKVVSMDSYKAMLTPAHLPDGKFAPYGMAMQLDQVDQHLRCGHSGGIAGFSAHLSYFPIEKLTTVILTNTETANAKELALEVDRALLQGP
jgi:CubicO group peptidase (beta-lactamase class C family)